MIVLSEDVDLGVVEVLGLAGLLVAAVRLLVRQAVGRGWIALTVAALACAAALAAGALMVRR